MSNEQNHPQEGQPLTAEEIVQKHCNNHQLNTANLDLVKQKGIVNGTLMFKFVECMAEFAAQETAALREELEKTQQDCRGWKSMHDAQMAESKYLKAELLDKGGELEAVKKERDEQKEKHIKQYSNLVETVAKFQTQLSEVTRQRDEALDIASELLSQLKYVQEKFIQTGSTPGVITQCETRLSRLSSGETKQVKEWIRVSDRLPELGKAVDIYKEGEDMYNTARIEHRDIEGFFKWNEATHWRPQTPLPALPESLTD